MDRVILQQVGVDFRGAQVVDRNELQIIPLRFHRRAEHHAPDAAKTVDCYPNSHALPP